MSIIDQARLELKIINFGDADTDMMIEILKMFFEQWDSGGAVHAVAPILQRLIAGKCLSPLTGKADEWNEVGTGVFQNRRCSTVLKDPLFHAGLYAYDLDGVDGPRAPIEFPYYPDRAEVRSPVMEVGTDDPT